MNRQRQTCECTALKARISQTIHLTFRVRLTSKYLTKTLHENTISPNHNICQACLANRECEPIFTKVNE